MSEDSPQNAEGKHAYSAAKQGNKIKLLTLADLDRRTRAVKRALGLRDALLADLGGKGSLSVAERELAQHASMLTVMLEDAEARWLRGEQIEQGEYGTLLNSLRRTLSDLGLESRATAFSVGGTSDPRAVVRAIVGLLEDAGLQITSGAPGAGPAEGEASDGSTPSDASISSGAKGGPDSAALVVDKATPENFPDPERISTPEKIGTRILCGEHGAFIELVEISGSRAKRWAIYDSVGTLHGHRRDRQRAEDCAASLPQPALVFSGEADS